MPVHVADLAAQRPYIEERDAGYVAAVELGGARTFLAAPMLKEDELIGLFSLYRQEVRPFTDKQIALVQTSLLKLLSRHREYATASELRESLQEQTATSEVLQVISSSPGDVQPVFATMLEKAVSICDATFGNIFRRHATQGTRRAEAIRGQARPKRRATGRSKARFTEKPTS